MTFINISNSFSPMLSNNTKVLALEKTLSQSLQDFKDLLSDFEQLHIDYDSYKTQLIKQQERCGSNSCSSAEALKRIIESKDNIIQLVASTLTRLNETKDLKILDEVFKILFGETPAPIPSYQDHMKCKDIKNKTSPISIKKDVHSSLEDLSFRDESVSEIEGTPTTGRVSPIIPTKKLKSSLITSTDFRDKKKCPDNWSDSLPEAKSLKISFSTPPGGKKSGRLRQSRLNLVKVPESNIIDITSSPEFSGGCRSRKIENEGNVAPLMKKESIENDDTILPSPTSGPNNFNFKSKESPMKFKKPPLSLKIKPEKKTPKKIDQNTNQLVIKQEQNSENILMTDVKMNHSVTFTQEDSINLLNPKRLPKNFVKHSPMKAEGFNDETYCDTQSSMSLLHQVDQLENIHRVGNECSPTKRPLAENINVTNMQDDDDMQPSMSVLHRECKLNTKSVDNVKRKIPELAEIEYDELSRRTRAEKRLLPGWICEECKEFFGELYKNDPEMLAKKINECSHHRGVTNPTDKTKPTPAFWNPRWNVPEDTEEFNRKNNVA